MKISIPFDKIGLEVDFPDQTRVYSSSYPSSIIAGHSQVLDAIRNPIDSPSLKSALGGRRKGRVVIVVSDITRPVPYKEILPALISEIESAGVYKKDILILIATGMHRPSTSEEREYMFGSISGKYEIKDHDSERELEEINGTSGSGRRVLLNKEFVKAGFKIITGLVEPHFMAGFSGGRKAVCPGLVSLETIQAFHGYDFLSSPWAKNACLEGNPCHEEALSIAKLAGVDFSLNVILDRNKKIVKAFAGGLVAAHDKACDYVKLYACPVVEQPADVVVTGCGGSPLDATFYQCVKGIVSAVPAVKKGGMIIAAGGCKEGMGSNNYRELMFHHSCDFKGFLEHIRSCETVAKDQWQLQMHSRAIEKVGYEGLVFLSFGLDQNEMAHIGATAMKAPVDSAQNKLQKLIDDISLSKKSISVIPEGPYCSPIELRY
jgi:nickel-dependent lactate racemase